MQVSARRETRKAVRAIEMRRRDGLTVTVIAERLGVTRRQVFRYLAAARMAERVTYIGASSAQ